MPLEPPQRAESVVRDVCTTRRQESSWARGGAIWRADSWLPALIFLLALGLYQYHIDHPPAIVFDEAHYVRAARNYADGNLIDYGWGDPRPYNFEHPPLGKYLIAAGIWLNGNPHDDWANEDYIGSLCAGGNPECAGDARGWRSASTIVGASGVAAAYLAGLRLFGRRSAGVFASLLLAFDGMYYLHARLAMLDIFATAFAVWAVAFSLAPSRTGPWLGGVFLGLAIASKYYALYVVPFVLALHLLGRWRRLGGPADPVSGSPGGGDREEAGSVTVPGKRRLALESVAMGAVTALLTPALVLLVAYAPYFYLWGGAGGVGFAVNQWGFIQREIFVWDFAGDVDHEFKSPAITWLPLRRPVWYYNFNHGDGTVGEIYSLGNPVVWWTGAAVALFVTAAVAIRLMAAFGRGARKPADLWRAAMGGDGGVPMAVLLFWATYLPWFLVQRILFLFYMTFVVPSLALVVAGVLGKAWDAGGSRRLVAILFASAVGLAFCLYHPVLAASPIDRDHFNWLMSLIPWLRYTAL